jgi:hypothetical protein
MSIFLKEVPKPLFTVAWVTLWVLINEKLPGAVSDVQFDAET